MPQATNADSITSPASHRATDRDQRFTEALIPMPEHDYEGLMESLHAEVRAIDALNLMMLHTLETGEVKNYVDGIHHLFQRSIDELYEIGKAVEDELLTSRARAVYAHTVYSQLQGQWKTEQDEMNAPLARMTNMKPFVPSGAADESDVSAVQTILAGLRAKQAAAEKLTGKRKKDDGRKRA